MLQSTARGRVAVRSDDWQRRMMMMIRMSTGALSLLALVPIGPAEAQEKRPIEVEDMFAMRSVGAPVVCVLFGENLFPVLLAGRIVLEFFLCFVVIPKDLMDVFRKCYRLSLVLAFVSSMS